MKSINKLFLLPCALFLVLATGCSDYFNPETDDALDGDDYMSSLNEMSTGFLGILTKMQAVGDKEILLTDTRAELLEPTDQSLNELIALYNYDEDLSGNSYADPSPYYDVVIACNDYISNMIEFKANKPELIAETTYFEQLISSAIRVKVWAYMTIAEIYGQAYWFDDPIIKIQDVTTSDKFQLLSLDQVMDKCLDLLHNGYQGYTSDLTFSFVAWIDKDHVSDIANSAFRDWDLMVPPYEGLLGKCLLWKGAAADALGSDGSSYYQECADVLIAKMTEEFIATAGSYTYWSRSARMAGKYSSFYNNATPFYEEAISAIIYNYQNNQTNSLLRHFSDEYPNAYLLRPSETGILRWTDATLNPGSTGENDNRYGWTIGHHNANTYISKFRPVNSSVRPNAYQDDVHIYTFRAGDYLIMITEALNALGRFKAAAAVMNDGFNTYIDQLTALNDETQTVDPEVEREWKGFNLWWSKSWPDGSSPKYPYQGWRVCAGVKNLPMVDANSTASDIRASRLTNDSLIANEYLLEFAVEGRTYPALIRFAKRWNDPSFITTRVTPKYGTKAAAIASKIEATSPVSGLPGYFVPWDLKK